MGCRGDSLSPVATFGWRLVRNHHPAYIAFYSLQICLCLSLVFTSLVLCNSCQLSFFSSSLWSSPASTFPCKPSDRRHFCDYITFSRGTTTQAFEELGFSRALAAFISQELALTLWDVHWSWRPLKENALKKTGGPRKPAQSPTA